MIYGQKYLPSYIYIDYGRWFLGLVNTHVHTSQQLGRGIADDVDLLTWLHDRIWPYESNMTEDDSYISTLLCGIELIHSGVRFHTTFYLRFCVRGMNE